MNSDTTMYTFAERLKGFRKREGLTQDELANKLGGARRTISDWERGLYLPRYREAVLGLAEALGLSPADTNLLLIAAQYPAESAAAGSDGGAMRFEEAYVGRLVVGKMEGVRQDSGVVAPVQLSRAQLLDEALLLSRARCISSWQATGLSRETAIALADDDTVGSPRPEQQPSSEYPLLVLVADLGTGKSLIGERSFQAAIRRAASDIDAPVPVFLEARYCIGRLREAVIESAKGIGDVGRQGADIVIDGVDEAGGGAEGILTECRILVNFWPHTTAFITSRPLPTFDKDTCPERVDVLPLAEEEAVALITRLSGMQHVYLSSWPGSVRDAVRRPLFAILLGIYLQDRQNAALLSAGELLAYLVERALGRAKADYTSSNSILQQLAVLSIDQAGAYVPSTELAARDQIRALLDTGLVVEQNRRIGFPLAVLTEWFAAHSLASGVPDPCDLVSDLRRLELWRYPLIMFVSMFGRAQVSSMLVKLAEQHPAFTSAVVSEALPKWGDDEKEGGPFNSSEWGTRIRTVMQTWVKGIGPLSNLVAPVTEAGQLRPLAIHGYSDGLVLAWYYGSKELPEIVDLLAHDPKSQPLDWSFPQTLHPGRRPAWIWRWTRDILRDKLAIILRNKSLPVGKGPLLREYFWQVSLAMTGRGSYWVDPISLQDIQRRLQGIRENATVRLSGRITLRPYEVAWYKRQIADLLMSGATEIEPPWPGPDLGDHNKHWIWDGYSEEQFLRRTVAILGAAIEGYQQIVETWFQTFAPEMATAVLLPARFVGTLIPTPRETTERWQGPGLSWHWLPLGKGEQSLVDVQLGTSYLDSQKCFEVMHKQIRQFRSQAASWLPLSVQHRSASIFVEPDAATRLTYEWLLHDLKRVSWIDR